MPDMRSKAVQSIAASKIIHCTVSTIQKSMSGGRYTAWSLRKESLPDYDFFSYSSQYEYKVSQDCFTYYINKEYWDLILPLT